MRRGAPKREVEQAIKRTLTRTGNAERGIDMTRQRIVSTEQNKGRFFGPDELRGKADFGNLIKNVFPKFFRKGECGPAFVGGGAGCCGSRGLQPIRILMRPADVGFFKFGALGGLHDWQAEQVMLSKPGSPGAEPGKGREALKTL